MYRYGFQGQEKDDELKGEGNSLNYTFRMHDPRIGRFFAVDPLFKEYPELTPYQFASNSPIDMAEIEGLEGGWIVEKGKAIFRAGPVLNNFGSEQVAQRAAGLGYTTPKQLASYDKFMMQMVARSPKVQTNVAQLRCACAECTMDREPYLYLGGRNSIGNPIFREASIGLLTGGIGRGLFKVLPKVQIITKAGEAYTAMSVTEKALYKVAFNVASQTIAKKGNIGEVNTVEAVASAINGRGAVIVGESISLTIQDIKKGQLPSFSSPEKTLAQIVGGLASDSYGGKVNNYLQGEKNAEVVGEAAKFFVETVSNVVPDVIYPDDNKTNN